MLSFVVASFRLFRPARFRSDGALEALVEREPAFARTVDVTAGRLRLSELLRNIARASGVNLSVRSVEQIPVSCNFTQARVDDLIRFLCCEYDLDASVTGNIVSVFSVAPVSVPPPDPDVRGSVVDVWKGALAWAFPGLSVARKSIHLLPRGWLALVRRL